MPVKTTVEGSAVQDCVAFLEKLAPVEARGSFSVRFWDGQMWPDAKETPVTLVLNHPGALRRMFARPDEVSVASAYIYGDCDIQGDMEAIVALGDRLVRVHHGLGEMVKLLPLLRHLPKESPAQTVAGRQAAHLHGKRHSVERDRAAVQYHYDVSNEFYRTWLDQDMVYSCGYFASPTDSLDAAQRRKNDYTLRKLRLKPGQRLLDMGCGWGALVMMAAKAFGADATGITLSKKQAELASQRIRKAGLQDICRVQLRDYREVTEPESFDKLVSVGMFEHVGQALLGEYFQQAWRLLKPGGTFLNHGIARSEQAKPNGGPSFVDSFVFPDGELMPLNETLQVAERAGFEVRDVENLREHYALTLRQWVKRLEAHYTEARRYVDEVTYRVWRLYMAASAHGFASGYLNVFQVLLVKQAAGGNSGMPLTRTDWYGAAG